MPELRDLEEKLAALRRQIALGTGGVFTPLEILQFQRQCLLLWAQIERHRREQLRALLPDAPQIAS